MPIVTVCF